MDGPLKVLLLAGMVLLVSAKPFNNYRSLPDDLRIHIDKALENAHQNFGGNQHIAFHALRSAQLDSKKCLKVNVLLKVTKCKKNSGQPYKHRDECVERKENTPMIDCLVCNTKDNKELVDCARRFEVYNGSRNEIRQQCRFYLIGKGNIMSQKSPEDKQIGCIGCV